MKLEYHSNDEAKISSVQIFDVFGNVILENQNIDNIVCDISIPSSCNGLYFAKITDSRGKIRTEKIIVQ